jgi:hypothetical protein
MTEEKQVCGATERDFQFWMPLDVIKAPQGEMRVGGIATDEQSPDIQGEKVFVDGLDISYLKQRGAFNWNHQKGPGDIIGEIDIAKKEAGKLYVEGPLYPHVDQAKHVWNLIRSMKDVKSDRKLGLSIEGKIKERDTANQKLIKKAWIKNVAITYNPINQGTWVDMIKSLGDFQWSPCDGDCAKCSLCECLPEVKKNMPDPVEATSLSRADIPDPMAHMGLETPGTPVDTQLPAGEDGRANVSESKDVCKTCGKPLIDGVCYVCNPPAMSIPQPAEKAISAGHDIPATTGGVSGSALRDEDMEKKKKVTTYTKRDIDKSDGMTKVELAEWFMEKGYNVKEAAALAHLIFMSADMELEKAYVKGHPRVRRGHSEWVTGHERRLTKEEKAYKQMLTSAMDRWHKEGREGVPFAAWLREVDKKTYDKLVTGLGTRTSAAGVGMSHPERERVVRDFGEILGLPAKNISKKKVGTRWQYKYKLKKEFRWGGLPTHVILDENGKEVGQLPPNLGDEHAQKLFADAVASGNIKQHLYTPEEAKRIEGKTFKMTGEYDPDIAIDRKIEAKHTGEEKEYDPDLEVKAKKEKLVSSAKEVHGLLKKWKGISDAKAHQIIRGSMSKQERDIVYGEGKTFKMATTEGLFGTKPKKAPRIHVWSPERGARLLKEGITFEQYKEKYPTAIRAGRPPSVATMEKWMETGQARAVDGCTVDPDGDCVHGHPSWMKVLGYI